MNRQKWILLAVVLTLVGGTTLVLQRAKSLHRLGEPGLRMIAANIYDVHTNIVCTQTPALPESVMGYVSQPVAISEMEVNWLPKDTTFGRRFYQASNLPPILVNVILMGADRGSIHQPQICLTGQGWHIEKSELDQVRIELPHAYDLPVMKLSATKRVKRQDGQEFVLRSFYVYWFVADGHLTAKHGERMWWMARELLLKGTLQRWAYVGCWSQCAPGAEDTTYGQMKRFIAATVPQFQSVSGPRSGAADRP